MFDLPDAKRIRRSELLHNSSSSGSSPVPDEEAETRLLVPSSWRIDLEDEYQLIDAPLIGGGVVSKPGNAEAAPPSADPRDEDADTFAFRLFASASKTTTPEGPTPPNTQQPSSIPRQRQQQQVPTTTWRINIRSPTPPQSRSHSAGSFVNPHRPQSYYFTHTDATTAGTRDSDSRRLQRRHEEFAAAALSGAAVLQRALATTPWAGAALPWRVVHLPRSSSSYATSTAAARKSSLSRLPSAATSSILSSSGGGGGEVRKKRCRKSKRLRLLIRARTADSAVQAAALRERRTQRNRARKVKKKARDKAKKTAAAAGGGSEGGLAASGAAAGGGDSREESSGNRGTASESGSGESEDTD